MRIGLGSENAAKLRSVRLGCEQVFAGRTDIEVLPIKVRLNLHIL